VLRPPSTPKGSTRSPEAALETSGRLLLKLGHPVFQTTPFDPKLGRYRLVALDTVGYSASIANLMRIRFECLLETDTENSRGAMCAIGGLDDAPGREIR
jgi:hypothetical protein